MGISISMKPEHIIEKSIKKAQEMGIRIVRGPIFIIETGIIVGCNCSGAVFVANKKSEQFIDGFPEGWLKELCVNFLGKDTFWWYRYNFGFNQGRSLEIKRSGCIPGEWEYIEDEVSKNAARFAKKLGLY